MKYCISTLLVVLCCINSTVRSENLPRTSFRPDRFWLDDKGVHINAHGGGFLRQGETWYWFGEHKIAGKKGNTAQVGVHCYSSQDLYNWTNRGIALKVVDDPDSEITRGCILERPKVIYNEKTQKYVMWFHLELKGNGYKSARTGVAVSDTVLGPYRYLRSYRPNAGQWPLNMTESQIEADRGCEILRRDFKTGQMARDMTLFVDDDGSAYHIHASEENRTLHISELSEDYLSFSGKYIRTLPGDYNEAPAVVKHQGKYYMLSSGCTGWAPNAARSAKAEAMLGNWKPLGNPCRGTNPNNNQDESKTFGGQSTYIIPFEKNKYIAVFDVWTPKNPIDGRYIFLPMQIKNERMTIRWTDPWTLKYFE